MATVLKLQLPIADKRVMDAASRRQILRRYRDHARRFDAIAAIRTDESAVIVPLDTPVHRLEQEPTSRELEILQLISEGLANREIGQRLCLSEETVKTHVRHLLVKLRVRSRAQAVAVGFRRGLLR